MPLLSLQYRDQLPPILVEELDQLLGAVQTTLVNRLTGRSVGLLLGLQFREQLPPVVADELDQLVAAMQAQFAASSIFMKSVQRYLVTLSGTSATQGISVVDPNNTEVHWLGADWDDNTGSADLMFSRVELNSTGTQLRMYAHGSTGCRASVEVREYAAGFFRQPVQRGTIPVTWTTINSTFDYTLPHEVGSKASVRQLGFTTDLAVATAQPRHAACSTRLLNSTTLRVTRFPASNIAHNAIVSYEVSDPN